MLAKSGFSIIELLVVSAIIATFSVVLILNFRMSPQSRTAREQTASVVLSDIRRAQSMALAGSQFSGVTVCGFGIHYVNITSYLIYAGVLDGGATRCQDTNHNYQAGTDLMVENRKLINDNMEIRSSFLDVFFELPDPKTYINNSASLAAPPVIIQIQKKGQANCGQQSCTSVEIYTSGKLELK